MFTSGIKKPYHPRNIRKVSPEFPSNSVTDKDTPLSSLLFENPLPARAGTFGDSLHNPLMQWKTLRNLSEMVLPFATVLFLFAAVFGMMHIGAHGHMHQCPFMGMIAVCDMTPLQHLNAWQQMYTAIALQTAFAALLYTALAYLALRALFKQRLLLLHVAPVMQSRREEESRSLLHPILYALSSGILHSKAF